MKCPDCNAVLINKIRCDCGWTVRQSNTPYRFSRRIGTDFIDSQCQWRDEHGQCGLEGWMAQSTNGHGPWYCNTHFFHLAEPDQTVPVSRERGSEMISILKGIIAKKLVQEEPGANG